MTELHCHILPKIDDGAKDIETSIKLLRLEKENNVEHLIYTPHFKCFEKSLDEFISDRKKSADMLNLVLTDSIAIEETKLGAEVYLSPDLIDIDMTKLCIEKTNYMLIEFSSTLNSEWIDDVLYEADLQGIVPVIAHIERYPYAMDDLNFVIDLIEKGCVIQTNASTIIRGDKQSKLIKKMIKWGLIHIIASDAHSVHRRPPKLEEAFSCIKHELGQDVSENLEQNAVNIFNGVDINTENVYKPKKIFGRWI